MRRRIPHLAMLIVIAGFAALGPVAIASASDRSIITVVVQGIPKVNRTQARLERSIASFQRTHQAGAVIRATKLQDATILGFGNRLNRQSASTPIGAAGKGHILHGLALQLRSNRTILALLEGRHSLTVAQIKRAAASYRRGVNEVNQGIGILKQLA